MVDKFLYIAMTGAKQNMDALAVRANNLANANTDGFKADMAQARAMQAFGEGLPTRVFSMTELPSSDYKSGPLQTTGRNLDIAVKDQGWIAVQADDGSEAYTRAGSLNIDVNGMLRNSSGHLVMGDNGPINIPLPIQKLEIATDGTISVRPQGATPEVIENVGRIKLVNPGNSNLMRGEDGLFRTLNGQPAAADAAVNVVSGAVEGSNVSPVEEMVNMISLQRQFELQVKMMKTAEDNDKSAAALVRIS
nr:flagellar basal-body rod protein FlgF [Shewanella sp. 4t3-1-2LB]